MVEVGRQLVGDVVAQQADLDLDACIAEAVDPGARHLRVGILDGHHDSGHTGLDERIGARRGSPVVLTGLERDVDGRTGGRIACGG